LTRGSKVFKVNNVNNVNNVNKVQIRQRGNCFTRETHQKTILILNCKQKIFQYQDRSGIYFLIQKIQEIYNSILLLIYLFIYCLKVFEFRNLILYAFKHTISLILKRWKSCDKLFSCCNVFFIY
jgi:hypothetical protein